jgi:hypothetical protein
MGCGVSETELAFCESPWRVRLIKDHSRGPRLPQRSFPPKSPLRLAKDTLSVRR